MSPFLTPVKLTGQHARLVPLAAAHHDDLAEAVQDGALWQHWYTLVPAPAQMAAEIETRLARHAQGNMLPFAVIESASGKAVGMTTYLDIDSAHRRLEIGYTWYAKRVQRTGLNTECKRLLLTHAFETLGCIAVEFRTHFFNQQSRRGIERLGAKLDGILRNHRITQHPDAAGTLRDTCVYSIIASEWPTVKAHLDYQLARHRE
ncbi:MAG: GNAT family N-acetyltransferase [Burkholderiaceae bacterium]